MGTVDDYLAGLAPADAALIGGAYAVARQVVPDAEQGTSYGMPALLYRGKGLLAVMRAKTHIGVYPFSAGAVEAVADRLDGIDHAKGTIRLSPDAPLDESLIAALAVARAAQIDG